MLYNNNNNIIALYIYNVIRYGTPQDANCKPGEESPGLSAAIGRYIESLAAYSIISYLLGIKDRHNGNVMLTASGTCYQRIGV